MPKTVKFVLGIHNHQPTGNFDHVFADAFRDAYEPFIDVLERHPKMKLSLHFTGILLDWLVENRPDYIKRLRQMGQRGQIEFLTGGYYEPILPVIPDHDKVGQIIKLSETVRKLFKQTPRGMWLAERVWEPTLPKHMREAGVEYTIVDDMHFKSTGITEHECLGHSMTEELGCAVSVFPISERLRYTIPFQPVSKTIDWLRSIASESGDNVAIMADDGEKFGVWPNTHEHCYKRGWLNDFFTALDENRDWIEVMTFGEALDALPPRGRVYLPTASYIEMMEWALPPVAIHGYEAFVEHLQAEGVYEKNKIYVRGGFWRSFQAKYEESNLIHKRMLHISEKVHRARLRHPRSKEIGRAQECLWQAQCNCAYWHGIFGGLYLTNLRNALQRNLIEADAIIEKARHKNPAWIESEEFDIDIDGHDEILLKTPIQNLLVKPNEGGNLIAHDFKPANLNLLDTLRRREEAYHTKLEHAVTVDDHVADEGSTASIHDLVLAKEPNLQRLLTTDWHRRASLIDHFMPPHSSIDEMHMCHQGEDGDFVNQPFTVKHRARAGKGSITLTRDGALYQPDGVKPLRVEKKISVDSVTAVTTFDYALTNTGQSAFSTRFGVEFNANLLAGEAHDRWVFVAGEELTDKFLNSKGESFDVEKCGMVDEWMGVKVTWSFDRAATLWRFPIETVSLSEAGFERVYQSTVIFPHWDNVSIDPGDTWKVRFKVEFESLR